MRATSIGIAALALTAAAAFVVSPGRAEAASFDGTRARAADERAICGNRGLEDRDVRMATLYTVNRQLAGGMGALGAMADRQRAWLAERSRCGARIACLTRAYDVRIAELNRGVTAAGRR